MLSAIRRDRIDIIYVLISGPSFKEDKVLIEHIRLNFPKIIIIGTGDLFRELREESFQRLPQLDAVNLNFSTDGVVTYLTQASGHPIPNILYRWRGSIVCGQEIFPKKHNRLGIPRWDLFPVKKYRYPFAVAKPNVAMLTDFGCTFQCSFCPHGEIDFSLRPRQDVYDEIDNLIELGIKDIFFFDQTFGVNKPATNELCKFLSERDIHWTCFSRVDLLSDETAAMMANAGCHTVIFGIESADEDLLQQHKKHTNRSQMTSAISHCKKHGIRTCGTFILGLPDETEASIQSTSQLARTLGLDFASFNIATPAIGTELRSRFVDRGWVDANEVENLESSKQRTSSWLHHNLPHQTIQELQSEAVRSFYLRPTYLLNRLKNIKSIYEFKSNLIDAFYLLRG